MITGAMVFASAVFTGALVFTGAVAFSNCVCVAFTGAVVITGMLWCSQARCGIREGSRRSRARGALKDTVLLCCLKALVWLSGRGARSRQRRRSQSMRCTQALRAQMQGALPRAKNINNRKKNTY